MPAQKARSPVPVRTTARTAGSASASFDRLAEARMHRRVEGVARLGAVEADDEDVAAPLAHELVGHRP